MAGGALVECVVVSESICVAVRHCNVCVVEELHIFVAGILRAAGESTDTGFGVPVLMGCGKAELAAVESSAEHGLHGLVDVGAGSERACSFDGIFGCGFVDMTLRTDSPIRAFLAGEHKLVAVDAAFPTTEHTHRDICRVIAEIVPHAVDVVAEKVRCLHALHLRGLLDDAAKIVFSNGVAVTVLIYGVAVSVVPAFDDIAVRKFLATLNVSGAGGIQFESHRILEGIDTCGVDPYRLSGFVRGVGELDKFPTDIGIGVAGVIHVGTCITCVESMEIHRRLERNEQAASKSVANVDSVVLNVGEACENVGISPVACIMVQIVDTRSKRLEHSRLVARGGAEVVIDISFFCFTDNSDIDIAVGIRSGRTVYQFQRQIGPCAQCAKGQGSKA